MGHGRAPCAAFGEERGAAVRAPRAKFGARTLLAGLNAY